MTITLRIEYQALWGSEVFVFTGQKVQIGGHVPAHAVSLENDGNGHWFVEVQSEDFGSQPYHYAVAHQKVIVAAEWGQGHRIDASMLHEGAGCLRLWNTWLDKPEDMEFHTLGFTQSIFRHPQPELLPAVRPDTLTFRVEAATIRPEHKLAVLGNIPELGEWDTSRAIVAEPDGLPYWRITIDRTKLHYPIYYKFVLVDAQSGEFIAWEERTNRFFEPTAFFPGDMLVVNDLRFANPLRPWHGVGVNIDMNRMRGEKSCAIGEFADIKTLIDWAATSGLRVVKLQPVNDCGETSKDPYKVSSGVAIDFRYIRPTEAGILQDKAFMDYYEHRCEVLSSLPKVKLSDIKQLKSDYLCKLFLQEGETHLASEAFISFQHKNHWWLDDYSRLVAERNAQADDVCLRDARFYQFVQFHLFLQLQQVRDYARQHGILLMGTTPHGILKHSLDAELYRQYYNLGLRESHSHLSKVRQQRNLQPTYNWFALENDNYKLLSDRLEVIAQYFDACDPTGLLGSKQEISEFWHIIADKAFLQLKENSPILLYQMEDLTGDNESTWWEVQNEILRSLQSNRKLISVLPLEKWIQLSDKKLTMLNNIETIVEDQQLNTLIHQILSTNKLLF